MPFGLSDPPCDCGPALARAEEKIRELERWLEAANKLLFIAGNEINRLEATRNKEEP